MAAPEAEMEVLVECGEPGEEESGGEEHAGVVSVVAEDEGTSPSRSVWSVSCSGNVARAKIGSCSAW